MSTRTIGLDDELYAYLLDVSLREHDVLRRLRDATATHPKSGMQISPEQGQLMSMLVKLTGARSCIELGVFTGYSSLAVALALPDDGRIVACDVSEEFTSVGRPFWREAGVADKIDLRIAPGLDTLQSLIDEGRSGTFDFAFIDADKENYSNYFDKLIELMRPGGLMGFDNTLWGGSVIDSSDQSESTTAIRALNEMLHGDERIDLSLLPIGDGLTLARKR